MICKLEEKDNTSSLVALRCATLAPQIKELKEKEGGGWGNKMTLKPDTPMFTTNIKDIKTCSVTFKTETQNQKDITCSLTHKNQKIEHIKYIPTLI